MTTGNDAPIALGTAQFVVLDNGKPVGTLTRAVPLRLENGSVRRAGAPTFRVTTQVPISRGGQQGYATLEADLPAASLAEAMRAAVPAVRAMIAQGVAEATARGFNSSVGGIVVAGSVR